MSEPDLVHQVCLLGQHHDDVEGVLVVGDGVADDQFLGAGSSFLLDLIQVVLEEGGIGLRAGTLGVTELNRGVLALVEAQDGQEGTIRLIGQTNRQRVDLLGVNELLDDGFHRRDGGVAEGLEGL